VKPNWKHCDDCGKCAVAAHTCSTGPVLDFAEAQKITLASSCHLCGEAGHRRKECPNREVGVLVQG